MRLGNTLMVHRPYFSEEYFRDLSSNEAKKSYRALSGGVKEYLKDMDIPSEVIEEMFQYSSNEMRTLDDDMIISMRLSPFYQEWINANCELTIDRQEPQDLSWPSLTDELYVFPCFDKKRLEIQSKAF